MESSVAFLVSQVLCSEALDPLMHPRYHKTTFKRVP